MGKGKRYNQAVGLFLSLILCACGNSGTFRLRGDFTHLREGDFYIYSTDGGLNRTDTIHVKDGQFKWETPLEAEATFTVVFPNLSELVIFANPGDRVKMKGDAQQLRMTQVTGNKENKALTQFRTEHAEDSPAELREAMEAFIVANPDSRVSTYLRRQLILQQPQPSRLRKGQTLDTFVLPPDQLTEAVDSLRPDSLRPVLLFFWASWKRDTRDAFFDIRRLMDRTASLPAKRRPHIISVSLDVEKESYRSTCRYDSVLWDSRCYRQSWDTPLVQQFGIRELPLYILTDSAHVITALGTDWKRDIKPTLDKLFR